MDTVSTPAACPIPNAKPAKEPLWYRAYVVVLGLWKLVVGVAFTQLFLTSILVVGWTFRAAQRAVQKHWWRVSRADQDACFCNFAAGSAYHRGIGGWPNWILENDRAWMRAHKVPGVLPKLRAYPKTLLHSLWLNFKIGSQVLFNTCVFVMPGCALMLFAWYAGWLNSFNKGYEQAAIGPLTGIGGIILFIAAMYYVPMAQIRQASTGDWKSFYQFRIVWQIIRKRWLACFGLGVLYSLLAVPFMIIKTAPGFFGNDPRLAALSSADQLNFAQNYYFFTAFVLFAIYLVLRLAAAWIYASSLLACVQSGALPEDALAENEWETLHRLDLLTIRPQPMRHRLVRTVAWCGTRVGRVAVGFALVVVWFTFIAQVFVSEFVLKTELGRGWLNQPLVQLPWFNYIPQALSDKGSAAVPGAVTSVVPVTGRTPTSP